MAATRSSSGRSAGCAATLLAIMLSLWTYQRTAGDVPRSETGTSNPTCPGAENCYWAHGLPGCNDPACCEQICSVAPFCCSDGWSTACSDLAINLCKRPPCQTACGKVGIGCMAGTAQHASRRPVGRLFYFDTPFCTAWLIAAPNLVLTARHCVGSDISQIRVEFNYECADCDISSFPRPTERYAVVEVVRESDELDYALLRLEGDPASNWGVAPVSYQLPIVGTPVYEIHHGNGWVKGYDEGMMTSVDIPGACGGGSIAISIGVDVIATGGASGAPIFDAANHCVVGLCHCGPPCEPGHAIPMSAILTDLAPTLQMIGAQTAPCHGCDMAGDLNTDGVTDGQDIATFVVAIFGEASATEICRGDMNGDSMLTPDDLEGFAALLIGIPWAAR